VAGVADDDRVRRCLHGSLLRRAGTLKRFIPVQFPGGALAAQGSCTFSRPYDGRRDSKLKEEDERKERKHETRRDSRACRRQAD
jgi:hypothetical protein